MTGRSLGKDTGFLLGLLVLSGALGLIWNASLGPRSAWTSPPSIRSVDAPVVADIGFAELREAIGRDSVIVIDARSDEEFEAGHLPHARNLPWNASKAAIEGGMAGIRTDARKEVVIYCSSVVCEDADRLAERLEGIGKSIRIYRGGWEEWQANMGP